MKGPAVQVAGLAGADDAYAAATLLYVLPAAAALVVRSVAEAFSLPVIELSAKAA